MNSQSSCRAIVIGELSVKLKKVSLKSLAFILKACGCVEQQKRFARIKMRILERKIELLE